MFFSKNQMLMSEVYAKLGFSSMLKSKFVLFIYFFEDLFYVNRDQNNIGSFEHCVHSVTEWRFLLWLWGF